MNLIGRKVEATESGIQRCLYLRNGGNRTGVVVADYIWDTKTGEHKWTVQFAPKCYVECLLSDVRLVD